MSEIVKCGECVYRNIRPGCHDREKDWFCADGKRAVAAGKRGEEKLKKLISECFEHPENTCIRGLERVCPGCVHETEDEWCDRYGRFAGFFMRNGVVALPTMIGDTVWLVEPYFDEIHVLECRVFCIFLNTRDNDYRCGRTDGIGNTYSFLESEIGEKAFFDKEEAERKAMVLISGGL